MIRDRTDLRSYFAGLWRLDRAIRAPDGRALGRLTGEALFSPEGDALVCREAGRLVWAGVAMPAERVTRWRFPAPGRVAVAFADDRAFHAFDAIDPRAEHPCGADLYRVAYVFGRAAWVARWRVTGPAKNYAMTTRYLRHRPVRSVPLLCRNGGLGSNPAS